MGRDDIVLPLCDGGAAPGSIPGSGAKSVLLEGQLLVPLEINEMLYSFPPLTCCYVQTLLWMEPSHPIVISRLAFVFLCALPAVRELYQYLMNPK